MMQAKKVGESHWHERRTLNRSGRNHRDSARFAAVKLIRFTEYLMINPASLESGHAANRVSV